MEAMKLPIGAGAGAAMVNGGRVLRSQTAKTLLVDTKISFKAKKTSKESSAKREGGEATAESVVASEVVRKPKKTTTTRTKKTTTSTSSIGVGVAAVAGSDAVAKLWSVSLSTEGALAEATKHLVAADAKLKEIIESHGAVGPVWEHKGSAFSALARAIVYQQLAGRAADVIYGRLITLCGGAEGMTPAVIAALSPEDLRTVGISGRKATYLHDLAEKFTTGFLSDEKLAVMSEDELVTALTAVKGIGVWTAHMFMIFHLHKSDVLPVGDLGIRKGFQKLFQLKQQPSAVEMETLALSWRPYRTLASWYLWRLTDIKVPDAS